MNKRLLSALKAKCIYYCYFWSNQIIYVLQKILWPKANGEEGKKICIYRIGNVGDIICAVPAIIAIRRTYPKAHLTLLTSPGERGMPGAKELLSNAGFLDNL
jgi:hypothetical protein